MARTLCLKPSIELVPSETKLTPDLEARQPLMFHPEVKGLVRNLQIRLSFFFGQKGVRFHRERMISKEKRFHKKKLDKML